MLFLVALVVLIPIMTGVLLMMQGADDVWRIVRGEISIGALFSDFIHLVFTIGLGVILELIVIFLLIVHVFHIVL